MTCKVMLVGEGKTDIGDLAVHPAYRTGREGFLQPLLRSMVRVADERVELEFVGQKLMYLPREPAGRVKGDDRTAINAGRALALAARAGARALVLAFDVDKTPGRRASAVEGRRKLRELRESAERGFDRARRDDPSASAIPTILAVPYRMLEAWALADREALARLLEVDVEALDYVAPEDMWGDEQAPDSDHPKCVWHRVTDGRLGFSEVGEAVAPGTLREACPSSFPPFAADVEAALATCGAIRASAASSARRRRAR